MHRCPLQIGLRPLQQGTKDPTLIAQHLAKQLVLPLDFVGAFINDGRAGVAHDLLTPPFVHIAMPAKDLKVVAAAAKGLTVQLAL